MVFYQMQGSLDREPQILNGTMENGRFGFSVANAGDLNADGHEGVCGNGMVQYSN